MQKGKFNKNKQELQKVLITENKIQLKILKRFIPKSFPRKNANFRPSQNSFIELSQKIIKVSLDSDMLIFSSFILRVRQLYGKVLYNPSSLYNSRYNVSPWLKVTFASKHFLP